MLQKTLFYASLILLLGSCKKEEQDFRTNYTGNFDFVTIEEFWMLGQPTQYDTTTFQGSISRFQPGDENTDLFSGYDSLLNIENRIKITFGSGLTITPEITEKGIFIETSGYHYYHAGGFKDVNEIEFVIGGLGGLGAGWNYQISGKRN